MNNQCCHRHTEYSLTLWTHTYHTGHACLVNKWCCFHLSSLYQAHPGSIVGLLNWMVPKPPDWLWYPKKEKALHSAINLLGMIPEEVTWVSDATRRMEGGWHEECILSVCTIKYSMKVQFYYILYPFLNKCIPPWSNFPFFWESHPVRWFWHH